MGGAVDGATIGGGGQAGFLNTVSGDFGTVGGGRGNSSGLAAAATVGGGLDNVAVGTESFVGGGSGNTAGMDGATVGGGMGAETDRGPDRDLELEISQDASVQHMGPMAQDFHAAFGLGDDDTRITTVDPDGVALAAIQGVEGRERRGDPVLARAPGKNGNGDAGTPATGAVMSAWRMGTCPDEA